MKVILGLLSVIMLAAGQNTAGNYSIRFEPQADLQANAEIPFAIRVHDDLSKPVANAKVTLQIETPEHKQLQIFRAPAVEPGVYVAKPVFTTPGQWVVYVEVHRDAQMSARTIEFSVPQTARP